MNSWGWVGKRIVKVTSHLQVARGAVCGSSRSTEDQRQRVDLAGARGSVLWPGRTGPGIISPHPLPLLQAK